MKKMQTDTIRISSPEALFTMFTTLEPADRKMAVLRAIADPNKEIGHTWEDCLFAVAARAADASLARKTLDWTVAAKALGIPKRWVNDGAATWDDGWISKGKPPDPMTKNEEFRNRIREYLAGLEKTEATNVRELAHA